MSTGASVSPTVTFTDNGENYGLAPTITNQEEVCLYDARSLGDKVLVVRSKKRKLM